MFDFSTFDEKRAAGLVEAVAIDPPADTPDARVYAISSARFDPETGERMEDVVIGVGLADLQRQRAGLQAQMDALDKVIAALGGLKPGQVLNAQSETAEGELQNGR